MFKLLFKQQHLVFVLVFKHTIGLAYLTCQIDIKPT